MFPPFFSTAFRYFVLPLIFFYFVSVSSLSPFPPSLLFPLASSFIMFEGGHPISPSKTPSKLPPFLFSFQSIPAPKSNPNS
ncbi:hypothetical protein QBC42DRAFT_264755 [Cladorrhinum samala]|uniref:Secreted protein n=1 Tax=Cladorrhinum samala TaxID=585594 RepID=A0AAV9HVG0_9PEZI|nr:hypothetical protein QBC42DRAFT_264755 [Cladorrhinum samala]